MAAPIGGCMYYESLPSTVQYRAEQKQAAIELAARTVYPAEIQGKEVKAVYTSGRYFKIEFTDGTEIRISSHKYPLRINR